MNKLYYFNADFNTIYPWKLLKDKQFYFWDNKHLTKSGTELKYLKFIMEYND